MNTIQPNVLDNATSAFLLDIPGDGGEAAQFYVENENEDDDDENDAYEIVNPTRPRSRPR